MKSTPEMRARIRELMTSPIDDYDRAVGCVLDDLESLITDAAQSAQKRETYECCYVSKNRWGIYPARAVNDGIEFFLAYATTKEAAQEIVDAANAAQPPAAPVETKRKTLTIPPGHEAVRDSEGRATGEVRPRLSAASEPIAYQMTGDNGQWLDPMPAREVDQNFRRRYSAALASGAVKLRALYADEPQRSAATGDETCYIERSKVRDILIGSNVNNEDTNELLQEVDALPIFNAADFNVSPQAPSKVRPKCLCCEEQEVDNDGDECEFCRSTYALSRPKSEG